MNLILMVLLVAVLFAADFCDSAAVRSEEFEEEMRRVVDDVYPDNMRIQRATESEGKRPKRYCYDTPCGWISYNPITRRSVGYFMPNMCGCPDASYRCIRTGENVSTTAYVYHCRQNTTMEDIESDSLDEGESPEYGS